MKTSAVFLTLALACAYAQGTIYLKADAIGGNNGSSWSNAFTNWNDAIVALNALPGGADRTLHIAQGVYRPVDDSSTSTNNYVYGTGFVIRGGYRASEDGDMVRDIDAYATIISRVSNVNNLEWKHIEIDPDTGAVTETTTTYPVFTDHVFQMPPSCTGRYDTYYNATSSGSKPLSIGPGASGTVDGLYFVGFGRASSTSGVVQYRSGCGENWISNCTFTCNNTQGGAISDSGGTSAYRHISKCRFIGTTFAYGFNPAISSSGNTIIEECLFMGCVNKGNQGAGPVVGLGPQGSVVRRSVFTRNAMMIYVTSQGVINQTDTIIGGGNAVWEDCIITNNAGCYTNGPAPVVVSLAKEKNTTSGEMRGCLVADNISFFTMSGGAAYRMMGVNNTTYDNNPLVENCTFANNRLVATVNNLAPGNEAMMTFFGNGTTTSKSTWLSVVGCSFISNRLEYAAGAEGSTVVACRGVAISSLAALSSQAGIANCTFLGPADGVCDFIQYGSQSQTSTLLNCIFTTEDPNCVMSPIRSDTPAQLSVIDCAIENLYPDYQPPDYGTLSGVTYDHVPVKALSAGSGRYALVPAVKTPDIRSTADVSPNATRTSTVPASYAYRLKETETWLPLVSKLGTGVTGAGGALTDAFDTTRPQGSFTRGASQAFDMIAASGANLVLRRAPVAAGTLSKPANQAVATGTAITPVTATSENDFSGWYQTDDSLYSAANPLVISALDADLVLTAKFTTKSVALTFNLGENATFDASGSHSFVTNVSAGASFPEIPAFTVDDGWFFAGWIGLPSVVPDDDTTYLAKVITKSTRTLYVAPTAAGTGDGSSWENATDDFAAAYADAGTYVGEVRLKGGVYTLASTIKMLPNVTVVGGCDDNETIFTGDVNGDNYWKAGDATAAGAVWTDGVFNSPNPDAADKFWAARSVSGTDDIWYGFLNSLGESATNAVFRNVTFTGFARSAIFAGTGDVDGLVCEDCKFLANGTARNSEYRTVQFAVGAQTAFRACEFTGNYSVYKTSFSAEGNTNEFSNCAFDANSGLVLHFTFACETNVFDVTNCVFTRNYASGTAILYIDSTRHCPVSRMSDCAISGTRTEGACVFVNGSNNRNGGDYWGAPVLEIERCSFTDNLRTTASDGPLLFDDSGRYYWSNIVGCYFARNTCTNTSNGTATLVRNISYNRHCFIGCTFEDNEVVATAEGATAAIFQNGYIYTAQHIFGSVFARNRVLAVTEGNAAEFYNTATAGSSGFRIFSTVVDEANGQPLLKVSSGALSSAAFRSCALTGYDETLCSILPTFTDCYMGSAGVKARSEIGANGIRSLGLRSTTFCRWLGVPAWKQNVGDLTYWYYNKYNDSGKEFVSIGLGTQSSAATVGAYGVGLDVPPAPDARGAARKYRILTDATYGNDPRVAPGPVNADPLDFVIMVR